MSDTKITKAMKSNNPKKEPLLRDYVSDLDHFLQDFDLKEEAYSDSRRAEEAEYQKIGLLRDNPTLLK